MFIMLKLINVERTTYRIKYTDYILNDSHHMYDHLWIFGNQKDK